MENEKIEKGTEATRPIYIQPEGLTEKQASKFISWLTNADVKIHYNQQDGKIIPVRQMLDLSQASYKKLDSFLSLFKADEDGVFFLANPSQEEQAFKDKMSADLLPLLNITEDQLNKIITSNYLWLIYESFDLLKFRVPITDDLNRIKEKIVTTDSGIKVRVLELYDHETRLPFSRSAYTDEDYTQKGVSHDQVIEIIQDALNKVSREQLQKYLAENEALKEKQAQLKKENKKLKKENKKLDLQLCAEEKQMEMSLKDRLTNKNGLIPAPSHPAILRSSESILYSSLDDDGMIEALREVKRRDHALSSITIDGESIVYQKGDEIITASILDQISTQRSKQALKFYTFILSYIETNPSNQYDIWFTSDQGANFMGYSKSYTFNRAFDNVIGTLRKMGLGYSRKKHGKQVSVKEAPYFSLIEREGRAIHIKPNPVIPWDDIKRNYTVLSPEAFKLSDNSFLLYYRILQRARQEYNSIQETDINGEVTRALVFNINLRTVANHMCLPINKISNATTQIKKPIDDAITEIEDKLEDVLLTIKGTADNSSINEYFNGYLEVILKGNYLDQFQTIKDNRTEKIEKMAHQKRVNDAHAIIKADKIEKGKGKK